jgi:hypothetical protein
MGLSKVVFQGELIKKLALSCEMTNMHLLDNSESTSM